VAKVYLVVFPSLIRSFCRLTHRCPLSTRADATVFLSIKDELEALVQACQRIIVSVGARGP